MAEPSAQAARACSSAGLAAGFEAADAAVGEEAGPGEAVAGITRSAGQPPGQVSGSGHAGPVRTRPPFPAMSVPAGMLRSMTTVNSMTVLPTTTTAQASATGRTTDTPAHSSAAAAVEVIPLWAAPWSPAAQSAAKR